MNIQFNGKRALVTGAGKGIGRDIAKRLAELGAEVVALTRTQADLDSLQQEVPNIIPLQCDLGSWSQTRETLAGVGDIHLLVNNAGISVANHFLNVKEEDIDQLFNINYKALFNVSQVITKNMVEKGIAGAVVNISSIASHVVLKEHAVYASTKGAVDQLTKIMALELGPHKIRVNAVNPTVALTALGRMHWSDPAKAGPLLSRIPLGKFLEISDVVDAVMFLLSDYAGMVNGVLMPIEGGLLCG